MTRARGSMIALVMLSSTVVQSVPLVAQGQGADTTPVGAPYRAPLLVLASPAGGEGLPQDKPAIVLRYQRGELDDPLDLSSLAVVVDGENRSSQFHADSIEGWGSIDPLATSASAGQSLAIGIHQLAARICSTRGVCTDLRETITIVSSAISPPPAKPTSQKSRFLTALALIIALIQRLITF